jgi:hypothetical protein
MTLHSFEPTPFTLGDFADATELFESYEGSGNLQSAAGAFAAGTVHVAQLHSGHVIGVFREFGRGPTAPRDGSLISGH